MTDAQVPSGGKYSDTDRLTGFRFWLIRLIAGKSVILLNARIETLEREGVLIKDVDGLLMVGCEFKAALKITQRCAK